MHRLSIPQLAVEERKMLNISCEEIAAILVVGFIESVLHQADIKGRAALRRTGQLNLTAKREFPLLSAFPLVNAKVLTLLRSTSKAFDVR